MTNSKKKILIVDDEPGLLTLYVDTLSPLGFECLTAINGLEGLHLALTKNPEIILLDLRMPEMDGLTMLRELRQKEKGKKTPVIILSTLNDEKSVSEALDLGVSDFFEKSNWNPSELVSRIESNISKTK
jgi:two-component system alkaline phosphatase synthesis response regulator PhoP